MPFNNLNKTLKTINRTVNTANRTQRLVNNVNNSARREQRARDRDAIENTIIWKCECGTQNQTNFCGECGKPPVICAQCNAIISTKFCPDCGGTA